MLGVGGRDWVSKKIEGNGATDGNAALQNMGKFGNALF
jgi:hypothetical protein